MVEEIAISLDTFIIESSEVYHSKRNDYLTSSQLKRFLGFPEGMKDTVPDEIRKQNFLLGKAAHSMTLEGRTVFEQMSAAPHPGQWTGQIVRITQ